MRGSHIAEGPLRAQRLRSKLIAPLVVALVGLAVLVWPVAQAWLEAWEASRNIDSVTSTYDAMNDPERIELYNEAVHYNELLANREDLSSAQPYAQQLSFRRSEMIAYISIPSCSIRLPIFHGTDDKALKAGVGHLEGTSLPVGGPSTHCVLTAHTGMPNRKMFDDIVLLEPGDRFVVWVLGHPLAYEVTSTEVVLPEQTESLAIVEGEDLCTLVTCTPYGVNSHRLLVHARRCAYEEGEEQVPNAAVYVNNRTIPLLAAVGALASFAVILAIVRLRS